MNNEEMPRGYYARMARRGIHRRPKEGHQQDLPVAVEQRDGVDSRQLVKRRRLVDPTTCERDYTGEEIAFMKAMDAYKRIRGRPFPSWDEVLEVLYALGYRKVAPTIALPGNAIPPEAHDLLS